MLVAGGPGDAGELQCCAAVSGGYYPLLQDEAAGEDVGGGECLGICLDFRQNGN